MLCDEQPILRTPSVGWAHGQLRCSDRPGHDQHARDPVRCGGPDRVAGTARARADPPPCGVGRARRARGVGAYARGDRGGTFACARGTRRRGGHRPHQPARDDGPVGSAHGRAAAQRDRLAGHAHGRARARAGGRGGPRPPARARRPAAVDVLLRPQDRVAAGARARSARARGAGRAGLRDDGHVAVVEPHRRPRRRAARDRRHQRQPHDADGPAHARLARAEPRADGHPARAAAGDPQLQRAVRAGAV